MTEGVILGGDLNIFRGEEIDGRFLAYQIRHNASSKIARIAQGVSVVHISASELKNVKVTVPERAEQYRIVELLSTLDSRIDSQRHLVELLKKHKRGAIEKLFSSHRWPEVPLGEIAEINPKPSKINDEFFYADLESVEDGVLKNLNLVQKANAPSRAQRTVQVNDILFQMVRPYQQNNYLARHTFDKQLIASTGYAQLRTKEDPEFIYWQLHTKRFLQCVLERCTGSGYPAINASDLKDISVRIAPRTEQQKIAQVLRSLADKSVAEERLIHQLETLKRALLQQLFV